MNNLTTPQREHLYRGKRLDNSEWIDGFLANTNHIGEPQWDYDVNGNIIIDGLLIEVDPATIGQYINRNCDKTGARIFEGMEVEFSEPSSIYPADRAKKIGIIVFADCSFVIEDRNGFRHYRWMDYHVEIYNQPEGENPQP